MKANDTTLLLVHIRSLKDFKILKGGEFNYNHMGGVICEAILQAGLKYDSVVWPRVERLMDRYPKVKTTSSFHQLSQRRGLAQLLKFGYKVKLDRIKRLTNFFRA